MENPSMRSTKNRAKATSNDVVQCRGHAVDLPEAEAEAEAGKQCCH